MNDGDFRRPRQHSKSTTLRSRRTLDYVRIIGPAAPLSAFAEWQPPATPAKEREALQCLGIKKPSLSADESIDDDAGYRYEYIQLEHFSIYHSKSKGASSQLCTLDKLQNEIGYQELRFDGIFTHRGCEYFVQGVGFSVMAVDGYFDKDTCDLSDRVYIQSRNVEGTNLWYRLGKPAPEYERFYRPFLWLAQFAKFFIEYLSEHPGVVTLHNFQHQFFPWLESRYDSRLRYWDGVSRLRDFRSTVANNAGFLYKEAYSLDNGGSLLEQPVWADAFADTIKQYVPKRSQPGTIVTPFIYSCFKDLYFGSKLRAQILNKHVYARVRRRKRDLGLASSVNHLPTRKKSKYRAQIKVVDTIRKSDVVCVQPDSTGPWKTKHTIWFAYVQEVHDNRLDLIWLYHPQDTTIGEASYPFRNEMFLSDNCNCGDEAYLVSQVIGKARVEWFASDPYTADDNGLFVRQKFRTIQEEDTYDFVNLQLSDFRCRCHEYLPALEDCRKKFKIGETVLVRRWNESFCEDMLEPAQIYAFDEGRRQVMVRSFPRASSHRTDAKPNELLLSRELQLIAPSYIIRRCYIRLFEEKDLQAGRPPGCYARNGAGDFFFIVKHWDTAPLEVSAFPSIPIGPEPNLALDAPLRGLGIFCGAGNFDRGLEDGGAVRFTHAVDWDKFALHTYRANTADPEGISYFLGSVDCYLEQAMAGTHSKSIANVGAIDLIAAGSPCPGFSKLQPNKMSDKSLRNASMVASAVSFVDLYSPKYFALENVMGLKSAGSGKVFSQVLASLVALGYQVQQFNKDAWSYGSFQNRSRLFIVASAPGLEPLPLSPHTHAHPPEKYCTSILGKSSNGLSFGVRRDEYTAFRHCSLQAGLRDLPVIGDGKVQLCPSVPDMRISCGKSMKHLERIRLVPQYPRGMNLARTAQQCLLAGEPLEFYRSLNETRSRLDSGVYKRMRPSYLMPTVTTALRITDGISGGVLHWQENRSATIAEAKRAQGFLDSDVLVGSPFEQCKVVGNSVDRHVAFSLGLGLRYSWTLSSSAQLGVSLLNIADPQPVIRSTEEDRDGCNSNNEEIPSSLILHEELDGFVNSSTLPLYSSSDKIEHTAGDHPNTVKEPKLVRLIDLDPWDSPTHSSSAAWTTKALDSRAIQTPERDGSEISEYTLDVTPDETQGLR
ncbi:S-adenosyl-L-methionine-dependent methyltransferase [Polychaeton citri CBS 116435]|uniref:DNA (cytosine-5-)-methyltransferase n=1 Tax=Polychaeton citri CBS 116435 TaxID=1314669 RepID=A0A9P4QC90_9PEZI|nr:S-adenosyl-L-methionine-dependent methyltransferase [Polychaeton citri CBS 116435]